MNEPVLWDYEDTIKDPDIDIFWDKECIFCKSPLTLLSEYFTGALFINGFTKGIYVTTSKFRKGAVEASRLSGIRGIPIELMNAEYFYDALKLSQISADKFKIPKYLKNKMTTLFRAPLNSL